MMNNIHDLNFSFLSFCYFTDPAFWTNIEKQGLEHSKRQNLKKGKCSKCNYLTYVSKLKEMSTISRPFLAIFTVLQWTD